MLLFLFAPDIIRNGKWFQNYDERWQVWLVYITKCDVNKSNCMFTYINIYTIFLCLLHIRRFKAVLETFL